MKIMVLLMLPALAMAAFVIVETDVVPFKIYSVRTASMTPTIPSQSVVVVRRNQYKVGQVITFTASGETVTHRLISIDVDGIATTKGDGNTTVDPWAIPEHQIIGGVVAAPRQLGYWMVYLRQPMGSLSIVMAVLLWMQVWSLTKSPENAMDAPVP